MHYEWLLTYAELGKYRLQDIVRGDFAGDLTEVVENLADILRE